MYLEELIEVAVGLILIYIVVSVAVMSIQEWIMSVMKNRSIQLEGILREMLAEALKPAGTKGNGNNSLVPAHNSKMLDKIYSHALIKALCKGKEKPSYIPKDKFVLALFDIVISAGSESSTIIAALKRLKQYKDQVPEDLQLQVEATIDVLVAEAAKVGEDPVEMAKLINQIDEFTGKFTQYEIGPIFDGILHSMIPATKEVEVIKALKRGAATLTVENPQLKQTLDDIVQQAELFVREKESKLALARNVAEKWFDDTMDRASGWYKRTAQYWALGIGLVLALALNIDTVEVANRLWIQPTLRQSLVQAAATYQLPTSSGQNDGQVSNPVDTINRLQRNLAGLTLPIGWTFETLGPEVYNPAIDRCTLNPQQGSGGRPGKDVYGLYINGSCKVWTDVPRGLAGVLTKLMGLFITGAAAMQGAPFWFEILKKVVNVRATGAKPEEKAPASGK